MNRTTMSVLACLCTWACDGSPATDAGPASDASPEDGAVGDAGPPRCGGAECAAGEACVRGVCLATCGADLAGWDAALAADLAPVHVFCRRADSFGTAIDAEGTRVLDVTASPGAAGTDLVLSEWRADPGAGAPSPTELATATVTHDADTLLFAGGYVVAGTDGVLFGYTLGDATFSGGVLLAEGASVTELDATGNFDAAHGAGGFFVNGLGLEGAGATGQALYFLDPAGPTAARIVTGVGSSSGGVALAEDYALVGGLDDAFVGHVHVVSRAALEAAAAGGAAIADPPEVLAAAGGPLGSAFALVHESIVLPRYDASFALEALEAHPVEAWSEAEGATLGAATDLTTGPVFSAAYPAAEGGLLLRFAEGLLLVE